MTPDQIAALEAATKMPVWGWAVLGVALISAFLVVIDKTGYYLKRKRTVHFANGDTVKKDDLVDAFESAIKKYERNGGTKIVPGRGDICINHGERLSAVETHCETAARSLRDINRKLDNLISR